jgi:hypothetical protein
MADMESGSSYLKSRTCLIDGMSGIDELCDELMLHTFDCEKCINGKEATCLEFRSLRQKITDTGLPIRGLFLCP